MTDLPSIYLLAFAIPFLAERYRCENAGLAFAVGGLVAMTGWGIWQAGVML